MFETFKILRIKYTGALNVFLKRQFVLIKFLKFILNCKRLYESHIDCQ